jgi:outer membrane protein
MSLRSALAPMLNWAISGLVCCAVVGNAGAEEKPLWELGAGVGGAVVPDYPGSDESRSYVAPIPYVAYRGKYLKADRGGLRTALFDRRYAELSLSLGGSVPVKSEDNDARRGLPDLKPTLEVGPRLDVHVWRSQDERIKLDLGVPVRLPVTLASESRSVGVVFEPRVSLKINDFAGFEGWQLGAAVGPSFADRKYHQYFYGIDSELGTLDRPAFDASGGYSGASLRLNLSKRYPGLWLGGFVRYENLEGAAFEASPLVRSTGSLSVGFGAAWIFFRSKRMVETDE